MTSNSSYAAAVTATDAWSLPAALRRLRPEACGLLDALNERVWASTGPLLLGLVRLRVAQLIGNVNRVDGAQSERRDAA